MVKLQKTQVKIFCVALALVFIGSVVALGLSQRRRLSQGDDEPSGLRFGFERDAEGDAGSADALRGG